MIYSYGWFGVPGRTGGLTHAVLAGKPVCNVRLPKESLFQWCSSHLSISDAYQVIECERCKTVLQKEIDRQSNWAKVKSP